MGSGGLPSASDVYAVGVRVNHSTFGAGVVVAVAGEVVSVDFGGVIRKLSSVVAPMVVVPR